MKFGIQATHFKVLFSFLLGFYSISSSALEGDRGSTLEITADSAELNEQTGTAVYRGHVELKQGSLVIKSNELKIKKNEQGVDTVIATGKPATYKQNIESEKAPAKAQAESIRYYVNKQKIHLIGNAILEQAGNRFEGENIEYDIANKILTASSNPSEKKSNTQSKKGSKRVKMLLPPSNLPANNAKPQ